MKITPHTAHTLDSMLLLINDRAAPFKLNRLGLRANVAGSEHVKSILLLVKAAELEPEENTADTGENGGHTVIPNEERISCQRVECLSKGRSKSAHEEGEGHDERTHVLGSLGEGIFK